MYSLHKWVGALRAAASFCYVSQGLRPWTPTPRACSASHRGGRPARGANHPRGYRRAGAPWKEECALAYAILRYSKLKTSGEITASAEHMMRQRPTPNADNQRTDQNVVLVGDDDPAGAVSGLMPERVRKNNVRAVEVLMTASPEWWAQAADEQQFEWVQRSQRWLEAMWGSENVAHLQMHLDEKTPHLTGFIVPRDPDTRRLNARRWLGGRQALSEHQTSYAAAVADLGLERGVEGSKAQHERVKRHYGALNRETSAADDIDVSAPPQIVVNPQDWRIDERKRVQAAIEPMAARAATAEAERSRANSATTSLKAESTKRQKAQEQRDEAQDAAKAQAAQLRALPLPDVLAALGYEQDKHDPSKWKHDGSTISVNGSKWFDHEAKRGRGGAIDLTLHALNQDFSGAIAWLADRFGSDATTADLTITAQRQARQSVEQATQQRPPFEPPEADDEAWPEVRQHLVGDRGLSAGVVDDLYRKSRIYADKRRNAVFIARDANGVAVGAEVKGTRIRPDGTRFAGLARGSRKDAGGFSFAVRWAERSAIYITESAIDALSLAQERYRHGERGFIVASTAGIAQTMPQWLTRLSQGLRRIVAYDADKAGDDAAQRLQTEAPDIERLRPPQGMKDWNDVVVTTSDKPDERQTAGLRF